jgi:predicted nucleic acid-binding protein
VIALDTNVLARYFLADDHRQAAKARALIEDPDVELWLPVSVVLELAWVLRQKGVPSAIIVARFRDLLALNSIRPQMPDAIFQALRWTEEGLEVADAIHLAMSAKAEGFVTFDNALVKGAAKLGVRPTVKSL